MSAERRWDTRRFRLEESTAHNGGKRTVFIEHMTPGTTVPPHYHTRFSETFDLLSGSMTVYSSSQPHSAEPDLAALDASAQQLELRREVTVAPNIYHKYLVGPEETALRAIVTPGDTDFERLLMILNGLAEDGELKALGNSATLMAVIMGLSDAHLIGPAKEMLDSVKEDKKQEVEDLRTRLLEKYDNNESLNKLLAM